nr:Gag-Pol polyprotein [Tanacetum cinerariifolium]
MMASSPICLLSKASKTKSWLWHRRLSNLNFDAINQLARQGLVRGLSKLKFKKDHLCSACAMGKRTRKTHKPKFEDTNQEKLYLLHMDLCGPMRVESVNGKNSGLVPTTSTSTSYVPPSRNDWDLLFQPMFDELLNPPPSVVNQNPEAIALIAEVIPPVSTRLQLHEQALFCYYDAFLTSVEPKTYKEALTQSCWIEAMQEELNEFERLEDSSVALTAFAYADHAVCQDTRRSTSGSVQFLGERLISWSSKRYHFIKEQVENEVIELYFVNTEYQLADLSNKALGRDKIEFLTNKLGMRSFTPETLKKLMNDE